VELQNITHGVLLARQKACAERVARTQGKNHTGDSSSSGHKEGIPVMYAAAYTHSRVCSKYKD